MKYFTSEEELLKVIEEDYNPLYQDEKDILKGFGLELNHETGFNAVIFETREEEKQALERYLIDTEALEFITPRFLERNLKEEFENVIDQEDLKIISGQLKDPFTILQKLVDIEKLVEDIHDHDSVGNMLNNYDGEEITLIKKNSGQFHTLTLT